MLQESRQIVPGRRLDENSDAVRFPAAGIDNASQGTSPVVELNLGKEASKPLVGCHLTDFRRASKSRRAGFSCPTRYAHRMASVLPHSHLFARLPDGKPLGRRPATHPPDKERPCWRSPDLP